MSSSVALGATPDTKTPKDTGSRTLEESISGFIAGASLAAAKTIVKYPLDTATVRLQMPGSNYSVNQPGRLLQGSFRGITTPLVCNIPAGAVFFAVKDSVKELLGGADLPRWAATSLAVLAATFPYMLVRNPSEVIKTRQQAGIEGYGEGVSALQAFQKVKQGTEATSNSTATLDTVLSRFYVGYWENVLYTYPADVIKFVTYENLSGGRKNLPPLEGAIYGAVATATAQVLTTPLDVIRNRVMAGKDSTATDEAKPTYIESLTRIARDEGIAGLFAGVSPRIGKALLSGAIQFATYEETKQVLATFFQSKRF
jgi:solute carrier family 25 (mitochondrial S-adenosylmethionine transporter), member 26